jgi:hypothetical protein
MHHASLHTGSNDFTSDLAGPSARGGCGRYLAELELLQKLTTSENFMASASIQNHTDIVTTCINVQHIASPLDILEKLLCQRPVFRASHLWIQIKLSKFTKGIQGSRTMKLG